MPLKDRTCYRGRALRLSNQNSPVQPAGRNDGGTNRNLIPSHGESRKRYSRKFQRMAVERMETCDDVGELARELGVRPRCLYKWRKKLEIIEPGQEASRPSTHASAHRKEIHRLKQLLAEKTLPCKK